MVASFQKWGTISPTFYYFPTIARVFEKLIYQQLYQFLDKHKILGKQQYGFRSLHSTALALSQATNHWLMNIDNGSMNSVVFLDIRKAFYTIDHQILIKKLSQYGIQDDELNFVESYLENRTQCCSVNGKLSDRQKIEYGVPQGSILGPLLFIIYMNDLPLFVTNAQISMYADDTSLYNNIKSVSEINPIQAGLFWNHIGWGGHIVPPLCFSSICYPITTKLGMLVLWHKISQKQ